MKRALIIMILLAATQATAVQVSSTTNTACAVVSEPELRACSGLRKTHLTVCVSFPTGEVDGFFLNRKGYSLSTVTGAVYCDTGRLCVTYSAPGLGVQRSACQGDPGFDSTAACLDFPQIAVCN
jgi:hypothetical protein